MTRPVTVDLTVTELAAIALLCEQAPSRGYQALGARLRALQFDANRRRETAERQQDAIVAGRVAL